MAIPLSLHHWTLVSQSLGGLYWGGGGKAHKGWGEGEGSPPQVVGFAVSPVTSQSLGSPSVKRGQWILSHRTALRL